MKKNLFSIMCLIITASLNAQEYQTKASGNITDASIFLQRPLIGGKLSAATSAPNGHVYVVVNNDNVLTINEPCQLDSIKVMPKGKLIVNAPLTLLLPVLGKVDNVTDNGGFIQLPTGPETPPITTGVEMNSINPIKVYASHGNVVVQTNESGMLDIRDIYGGLLYTQRVDAGDNVCGFNSKKGIYIATINANGRRYSQKFVY